MNIALSQMLSESNKIELEKYGRIEMFRISPQLDKYYEYAEYTMSEGKYPNTRYFINSTPQYVGEFIKREEGGCGDGSWRIDYFRDDNMNIIPIKYTYEGTTCFREVPCNSLLK